MCRGNFESGFTARRLQYGVARRLQEFARHFAHVLLVFGEQHGFRAARQAAWNVHDWNGRRRLVHARKINLESGTFAEFAVHPDESAALLYYTVYRRQTQTGSLALFLGGEKRLENVSLSFRVHAGPGVRNCEKDVLSWLHHRVRRPVQVIQFDIRGLNGKTAALGHGVARIHREVHDDLFHLAGVRANRSQISRTADNQLDVFANQTRNELAHFFDDGIQIHRARLQHLHPAESEKLTRQRSCAIRRSINLFNLARDVICWWQNIQQQFRVALDHHQQIVEVVRDAACE